MYPPLEWVEYLQRERGLGSVEEMANCATFLAKGDHYMTGEVMHADGGWLAFGWGSKGR